MERRKFLAGSAAAFSGAALLSGAQSSSIVQSSREVKIRAVDDMDAYLGMRIPEETQEIGCGGTLEIPVTNQTKEPLDQISFVPQARGTSVEIVEYKDPGELEVGQQGILEVTLECKTSNSSVRFTTDLGFDIEASSISGDTVIDADRKNVIHLSCDCTPETGGLSFVAFCGDIDEDDIKQEELGIGTSNGKFKSFYWELEGDAGEALERVVLFGGFGEYSEEFYGEDGDDDEADNGPVYIAIDYSDDSSNTGSVHIDNVLYGTDDPYIRIGPPSQHDPNHSSCPCFEEGQGVKYDVESLTFEDGCGGKPDDTGQP